MASLLLFHGGGEAGRPPAPETMPAAPEAVADPPAASLVAVPERTEAPSPAGAQPAGSETAAATAAQDVLEVLVTDPAGIPVPAAAVTLEMRRRNVPDQAEDMAEAVSGEDGVARLPLEGVRELLERVAPLGIQLDLALHSPGPWHPSPRLAVPGGLPPPGERLRLQVPASGAVEVLLLDDQGRPASGRGSAMLWVRPAGGEERSWRRPKPSDVEIREGHGRYAPLGTGLELRLRGWSRDLDLQGSEMVTLPGPATSGETVTATLQLGPPPAWLAGRVLDEAGSPVTGASLTCSFVEQRQREDGSWSDAGRPYWRTLKTDAEGRFRTRFPGPARSGTRRDLLVLRGTRLYDARPGNERWRTRAPMPADLPPGETFDFGDLRLTLEPLLVTGQVVDGAGAPVRGATLTIAEAREDRGWHPLLNSRPVLDGEGRFRIHSVAEVEEVLVSAWAEGYEGSPAQRVPVGTTGLRLVLEPSRRGSLVLRVLLDEGIPGDQLHAVVRGSGNGRDLELTGGSARFDKLEPGTVYVEVQTQRGDWPLARVEDVLVPENAQAGDPRLDGLDLRGRLRFFRLRLTDEAGRPLAGERVHVFAGERLRPTRVRCGPDGRAVLLAPVQVERIHVSLGDSAPVECAWQDAEQTLALPRP